LDFKLLQKINQGSPCCIKPLTKVVYPRLTLCRLDHRYIAQPNHQTNMYKPTTQGEDSLSMDKHDSH
ncbi:hypothetical protein, partial [Staphylococcus gallinarum]|uniref:hypothetical protein n=1 Tax=Staphylococcus gallinarum TaxID=1293 RepID=UPI00317331D6